MSHPIRAEHAGLDLAPFLSERYVVNLPLHKAVHLAGTSSMFTHGFLPPLREWPYLWKGGKECHSAPVSGMIQSRVISPWTACHMWSTGSLCGLSVATYGGAACRDGRKPCHILCTDKSFLNGNCVRVSWPRIADHRTMEFIQKIKIKKCKCVWEQVTVSDILTEKRKKGSKSSLICSGFKRSWSLSEQLISWWYFL